MNTLEKCAEILVGRGYADMPVEGKFSNTLEVNNRLEVRHLSMWEKINPFADTIEGRRQADAVEDWLWEFHIDMWMDASARVQRPPNKHQWRLDRIRWCVQELIK